LISLGTTLSLLAQTGATVTTGPTAATTQGTRPGWVDLIQSPLMPIAFGILILYLLTSRSKKAESRKRDALLSGLKKGDEVVTIGGEIGKVVETRDSRVLLKVDESSNTKVWYLRSAIHRVLDDEADKKADSK